MPSFVLELAPELLLLDDPKIKGLLLLFKNGLLLTSPLSKGLDTTGFGGSSLTGSTILTSAGLLNSELPPVVDRKLRLAGLESSLGGGAGAVNNEG